MRTFSANILRAGIAALFLAGAGSALAADEDTLKSYDRDSMQRLFEKMASGDADGLSQDDMLVTGSVKADDKPAKDKDDDKR